MSQTQTEAKEFLKAKFPDTFLLNKTEASEALRVSRATLDRIVKAGELTVKKVQGQNFFKIDDVALYLAS